MTSYYNKINKFVNNNYKIKSKAIKINKAKLEKITL